MPQLTENLKELLSRHKLEHHRRYKIIADRRDSMNNDKLYLIIPKEGDGEKIHNEYEPCLNEYFFANTMQFLFPLPGLSHEDRHFSFTGLDTGQGYKFLLSYHLFHTEKQKMYFYLHWGVTRFFMADIPYLWPRYFNQVNKGEFQRLNDETQKELEKVIQECPMIDTQFEVFQNDAQLMQKYEYHKLVHGVVRGAGIKYIPMDISSLIVQYL